MKYKNQSNVSGLKVSDIVSMSPGQIAEMTDADLRRLVGRLVSAGNKRLRTFERNNEKSPAYQQVIESGGHFSTKGKNRGELIQEYNRARFFFQSGTSSVKDWRRLKQEVDTAFRTSWGENGASTGDVFALYDKLHKVDSTTFNRENKYGLVQIVSQMWEEGDKPDNFDSIISELRGRLEQVEDEREAVNNEFDVAAGLSGFFD